VDWCICVLNLLYKKKAEGIEDLEKCRNQKGSWKTERRDSVLNTQ